jgi:hypothetical protein
MKIFSRLFSILIIPVMYAIYFLENKSKKIKKIYWDNYPSKSKYVLYNKSFNFLLLKEDRFISRSTFVNGAYDYYLVEKSLRYLKKSFIKETFIDIGANIGTVCIPTIFNNLFKNSLAIEPITEIFRTLKVNVLMNNLENKIQCLNYCIFSKNNIPISFKKNINNFGDTRFGYKSKYNNLFPSKNVKCLDYFLKTVNPNRSLIKIDVQGAETDVLLGAKNFLSYSPPIILEFEPYYMGDKNYEIIYKIIVKNYRNYYNLNENNNNKYNLNELEELFLKLKSKKGGTNILFVR